MSDMFPNAPREFRFTGEELAHEQNREIRMRHEVYDRRIAAGKMTRAEADKKIAMADAILTIIQKHALDTTITVPAP